MRNRNFNLNVDSLLSNGLLYLLIAGYAALVYSAVVAVVMAASQEPIGDPTNPTWGTGVATLIIVALTLWPLRRWLQTRVDLMVYGHHDDAYNLLWQVNRQLQTLAPPTQILPGVVEIIAGGMSLPYLTIDAPGRLPAAIQFGRPPASAEITELPLIYLDRPVGVLRVAARPHSDTLSSADLNLLQDLAQSIAIALHVSELTAELQAARERVVISREEERRRIRNDLHDGLAPTLSALQIKLGAVRTMIGTDPGRAEEVVREVRGELRSATADIRRLVYALRPPKLDELGLIEALRNLGSDDPGLCLEVQAPEPFPALSAAVEVAVYRIASEAVHNVVKHAQATTCVIRIHIHDSLLTLDVDDNGRGLPKDCSAGVGMQSIKERAEELGGMAAITPADGGGVRVEARLPVGVPGE